MVETTALCPVHPGLSAIASCRRCGRFVCEECAAKVAERQRGLCPECAQREEGRARSLALSRFQIGILGVAFGAPTALQVCLAFLRPDLFEGMLDHWFGYLLVSATSLLVVMQTLGLFLFFRLFNRRAAARGGSPTGASIGLSAASVVVCTLPTAFLILFGPIVFKLTFGVVE